MIAHRLVRLLAVLALAGGLFAVPTIAAAAPAAEALKEDAVCTRCHDDKENRPVLSIYQTRHGVRADNRTPTCTSCHGPSEKHVKGDINQEVRPSTDVKFLQHGIYPASEPQVQSEACLTCHKSGARAHSKRISSSS